MNKWAFLLGAAVAAATVLALIGLGLQRARHPDPIQEIPDILADCFDRLHRLEAELQHAAGRR